MPTTPMTPGFVLKNTSQFHLHMPPNILEDLRRVANPKVIDPASQQSVGPLDVFIERDRVTRLEYVLHLLSKPFL
jgi:hypothetical protein